MTTTQFIAKSQDYWGPYPAKSAPMVQEYLASIEDDRDLTRLFLGLQFNLNFKEGPPSIADISDVMIDDDKVSNRSRELRLTDNDYPGTEDLMPSLEDDLEINANDRVTAKEHVGKGAAETSKRSTAAAPGYKENLEK